MMKAVILALFLLFVPTSAEAGWWDLDSGAGVSVYTVATLPATADDGTMATVTDGSTADDCSVGGGIFRNGCIYDGNASGWVIVGDGQSAGGGNSIYLEHAGAAVGNNTAADITVDATTGLDQTCVGQNCTLLVDPSEVDHDSLQNFSANKHIDWTIDQGATNVHAGNYTDTILDLAGAETITGNWVNTVNPWAINEGGTGAATAQAAIDALSAVSAATNEHVLTKDTASGNAIWKASAGGAEVNDLSSVVTWANVPDANITESSVTQHEAAIETSIDTLANLTSVQGLTVTLADAAADAIWGWDDTASAYENLTAAEVLAIVGGAANDFDASGDILSNTHDTAAELDALYEGELNNEAGLYAALDDVTNFLQTGDAVAGDDITDNTIDATELEADSVGESELIESMNFTGTGNWNFGGASDLEIPNSATPTIDTAGQIALDTTITSHDGLIIYYQGAESMVIPAIPLADLTTTDGHIIDYNSAGSKFTMAAPTGGSSEWTDAGTWLEPNTDGDSVRVFEAAGTDYVDVTHDGTSAVVSSSGADQYEFDQPVQTGGTSASSMPYGLTINSDADATGDLDVQGDTVADILDCDVSADACTVPTEVYGAGWNADLGIPTKDAVYDQMELKDAITTAGDYITRTANDFDVDAEAVSWTKTIYFETPEATDDFKNIFWAKIATTITGMACLTDTASGVNWDVKIDGTTDVNGTDIECGLTTVTDTSFAGDNTLTAGQQLHLAIDAVAANVNWVSLQLFGEWDD